MRTTSKNAFLALFATLAIAIMMAGSVSAATDTGDGFNDPDTFGDAEDDGLDIGGTGDTDTRSARGDGFNDPDAFGDPQDDGLDWNMDGIIDSDDQPRDLNNDRRIDNADVIIVTENQRNARGTNGTIGQSNNTWQTGTVGANNTTVNRSSSQGNATRGDTRAARQICSSSDARAAAQEWIGEQGDYRLADTMTLGDNRVYVYAEESTTLNARGNTGFGASDENLDRIGAQASDDREDPALVNQRNARDATETGLIYVIVSECEVQGVVSDDSVMFMPEDNQRAARDVDRSGFVTFERDIQPMTTNQRAARDTTPSEDRVMPWEEVGSDSQRNARDNDDNQEEDDSDRNLNLPAYVR